MRVTAAASERPAAAAAAGAAPAPAAAGGPAAAGAAAAPGVGPRQAEGRQSMSAAELFRLTTTNMGELARGKPISGYAGRWWRWQGASTAGQPSDWGRDVYVFRWGEEDGGEQPTAQVWLALTSQRSESPFIGPRRTEGLELETNIMELSPSVPMFQPGIEGELGDLGASMRTWAVEDYGFCTAPPGLPKPGGGAGGGGAPAKPWVATPLLRAPAAGAPGGPGERVSVKLKYCPATGRLLDTRHSWEIAIPGLDDVRDAFTKNEHPLLPPCIDAYFASASPRLTVRRQSVFTYSPDGSALLRATSEAAAPGRATSEAAPSEAGGAAAAAAAAPAADDDAFWWAAPTAAASGAAQRDGGGDGDGGDGGAEAGRAAGPAGSQIAEVWYPGGAYARAPLSLAPLAEAGADAVLEAGALLPCGGVARWVLRYSTAGDRRLLSATHQVFLAPGGGGGGAAAE
ncbi:hypothetical protein Rsub_13085 [Raphidocelis subcapitata]|uniref:Uncharacterized protein n=1 Tax=Raphidocelis subcapitata TaxID=307507 RepID=A0A2V0PMN4_9CHLO|nr:hypothetical protein Rsub_13085 [Raphidocelis subcapitata]|eukprot:GBG00353.1 hypothetical protein Rsub_13085 [Raphidocelis subcapitata]